MSMTSRLAGISSLIIAAENSIKANADASSGSMKPAEIPTATQFRCQNVSRCPGLIVIFLGLTSFSSVPDVAAT